MMKLKCSAFLSVLIISVNCIAANSVGGDLEPTQEQLKSQRSTKPAQTDNKPYDRNIKGYSKESANNTESSSTQKPTDSRSNVTEGITDHSGITKNNTPKTASPHCIKPGTSLRIIEESNITIDGLCSGNTMSISGDNAQSIILIKNSSGITIRNIHFTQSSENVASISIINSNNVFIYGNEFTGGANKSPIIHGRSIDGGSVNSIVIQDNTFRDSDAIAILFDTWKYHASRNISNIAINNNRFINIYQGVRFVQDIKYSKNNNRPYDIKITGNDFTNIHHVGILALWGNHSANTINNNRLVNICFDTDDKCNAISCEFCEGGDITYNYIETVRNCSGCKGDGAGIILDWAHKKTMYPSSNMVVSRNIVQDSRHDLGGGAIILWKASGCSVFSNVVRNSKNGIVLRNKETKNNLIYNNEIMESDYGISVKKNTRDNDIYNNIAVHNNWDMNIQDDHPSNTLRNNVFERCNDCMSDIVIPDLTSNNCDGGEVSALEIRPFVDVDGIQKSERPIGARACK